MNILKTKKTLYIILILFGFLGKSWGQATVEVVDADMSDHLDLEAIASVFGEAEDLEDFERRINDPEGKISNLDLNEDNYIDYLRVIESSENDTHYAIIQAVLEEDVFQDVATIDVTKAQEGNPNIQVVGDEYIYGPDYIIEPVYMLKPPIVTFFWSTRYRPYVSPYRWRRYPAHFKPWRPVTITVYRNNLLVRKNTRIRYYHTPKRRFAPSVRAIRNSRRDYVRLKPTKSFASRHKGISNRHELQKKRNVQNNANPKQTKKKKRKRN